MRCSLFGRLTNEKWENKHSQNALDKNGGPTYGPVPRQRNKEKGKNLAAFCLLPFAFYLLPFTFCLGSSVMLRPCLFIFPVVLLATMGCLPREPNATLVPSN